MKRYYKVMLTALFFLGIAAFLFLFSQRSVLVPENFNMDIKNLIINGEVIKVEIADTREKQETGLLGKQSLPEDHGMLFVFDHFDYYSFWMKDMNFSLDFIWINGDKVAEVTQNVRPEDYQPPKSLSPKNKIDKVLEVNAGIAAKMGIKEGDKIQF